MTGARAFRKAVDRIRLDVEFDARWYVETYPDVAASGLDPAAHFVLIGDPLGRDPGPRFRTRLWRDLRPADRATEGPALLEYRNLRRRNPDLLPPRSENVLFAAGMRDRVGDHAGAVDLACGHLPVALAHAIDPLRANAALAVNDEKGWLQYLNRYLEHFDLAPLHLDGDGPLFDRLSASPCLSVPDGPLISVLMPAWNAGTTLAYAARSILNQSWRRLELIVIDDASTDDTPAVMQRLAASDSRVRLLRHPVNSGPYVARNLALHHARGDWITGHDADDWAHPDRIARHMQAVLTCARPPKVSLTQLLRLDGRGRFTFFDRMGIASSDGVARRAPVSCLFEADFMRQRLGHWDSVRFGADSEMVARAMTVLGREFGTFHDPSLLCLDIETSLSNHADHGVDKVAGLSSVRQAYRAAWRDWHAGLSAEADAYLPFNSTARRFPAPPEMKARITPDILAMIPTRT